MRSPIFSSHLDSLKCWQARRILEAPTWDNLTSRPPQKKKNHQKILTKEVSPQRNCPSRSPYRWGEQKREQLQWELELSGYVSMLCLGSTRNSHLLLSMYRNRVQTSHCYWLLSYFKILQRQAFQSKEFIWEKTPGRISRDMKKWDNEKKEANKGSIIKQVRSTET